jgi:biopolymer transport protein TolR
MLVLLVVFMVTAPLLTTGLRIDLPDVKAANTPVKDARLLVTVTKDERVLFGETDITDRVPEAFRENQRVQTERELYIRADKEAHYGIVATVVAAARASGVQSLNLLVEPVIEELPTEVAADAPKTSNSSNVRDANSTNKPKAQVIAGATRADAVHAQ